MNAEKWFKEELESARKTFEFRLEKILLQLGEDICGLMRDQGLSRAEIAARLGVSRAYVTKLLNGNPNLTIKTLVKLSDALGREFVIHFPSQINRKLSTSVRRPRRALSAEFSRRAEGKN
jgi:transcriptional regulator with XRE-family HTH domain